MLILDRRRCRPVDRAGLRASLTAAQRLALAELERTGWLLEFVRHSPSGTPLPVMTGRGRTRMLLSPNGSLDTPGEMRLRD